MHKKSKAQQNLVKTLWDQLFETELIQLSKRITDFKRVLKKWDETHNEIQEIPRTDEAIINMYLQKLSVYTSHTRFEEFQQNRNIHDQMVKDLEKLDDAYIHYKMLGEAKWQLLLSQQTSLQIKENIKGQQNLKKLLTTLSLYVQGHIPINNVTFSNEKFLTEVGNGSQCGSYRYFIENFHDYSVLLSVGYEKLPKIQYQKTTANYMTLSPFIQILKVFHSEPDKNQIDKVLKRSDELYKNHPSKNLIQEKLEQDVQAKEKLGKKIVFFRYEKQSDDQEQNEFVQKVHPLIFKQRKCYDQEEYQQFLFSLKSFEEAKQNLERKIQYQNQQDQMKKAQKLAKLAELKQFFSFASSKQLIKIYEGIPNKKYKLTEDEKNIVTCDKNMIVIGRSGTGKTLCALLRLYIIEFFFKARQVLKFDAQKRHFQASDIDRVIGLKNVFLTASPYLIKEIKKQYDQMIEHLKTVFMEKDMERRARMLQNGEVLYEEEQGLSYGGKLFKDEFEYVTLDDLIEQFEEKIQRMNCLNDLNQKDFPGFFSIRKFVQLIDGTLQHPMLFKRKKQSQQVFTQNLDQKNGDNNVNSQNREDLNLKKKERDSQSNSADEMKEQEQKNFGMMESQQTQDHVGWIEEQKEENQINNQAHIKQQQLLVEVTYEVFAMEFWPSVPKEYFKVEKQLTPANIWSEVYSIIKGSYMSHKSHTKYLSKTQYLKLTKKQHSEEYEYKRIVYQIFQYYENWKKQTSHYDFMDLVNHILSDISVYGYQGPMLNYLFVDEVQDLPPATMYLVSKIVTNGVFYCGDSAQTIAKGVNFKFGDIPQMFHEKFQLQRIDLSSPVDQQLVVNFRSHNEILQLGHSVITMIEKLFPGSIDKLKSESSSFRGPIPMLLADLDEVKLLNILTDEITKVQTIDRDYLNEYQKHAPDGKIFKLGPEQIILVRNQEEKKKLPYRLAQGVVLTFEDVKGLEYDDVVLVNFFSSSRYSDKWKLLKYLDAQIVEVKKEEFEQKFKVKQDVKGHHLEDDRTIMRTFNWDDNMPDTINRNGNILYQVPKITYSKDIKGENIKDFYELLTELKILYTAITRARKTFIIYEKNIPKPLEKLWIKLNVIKQVTPKNYEKTQDQIHQYRRIHKNKSFENQQKAWIKEGFKWYIRKNYEQAIRCFKNINDFKTAKRIEGEMVANEAAAQMRRIRTQLKNPDNLPKEEFKIKKKMLESSKSQIIEKFIKAGQLFEEIQRIRNAGQCYYSGEDYKRAYECFKKVKNTQGCAQCAEALGFYEQASEFYEKKHKFERMLFCLEKSGNLDKVRQKLLIHLGQFTQSQATCIKYGKIILRYQVQNYLNSNSALNILWKHKNPAKYTHPQQSQINRNISRYLYSQTIKNLQKFVETKVKIQSLEKNLTVLDKQSQNLYQLQTQINLNFEQKRPFKNLKVAQRFYDLKQTDLQLNRPKPFAEACYQQGIRQEDALLLVTNYKNLKPTVDEIKQKITQKNRQIEKLNKELRSIQKSRGSMKEIDIAIHNLKLIFQKHKVQGSQNAIGKIYVQKINAQQIRKIQKESQLSNDFKNIKRKLKDEDLEISSFLDQSFESSYLAESSFAGSDKSFSLEAINAKTELQKGVIFNISVNRLDIYRLIQNAKQIVEKMKNYVDFPLKPPFSDQHHLMIDAKIQSVITAADREFEQIIKFLRLIERIGQDFLALFTCQFYQLYDLAKRFIISKITKINTMAGKSKKLTKAPFIQNKKSKSPQNEITQFLNGINQEYLKTQSFRTLSSKQKIINSIVQALLIQGYYRNALEYVSMGSEEKIQIAFAFMDYKHLYEGLLEKITKKEAYKFKDIYLFLSESKYKNEAKMMNQSSIQQIFFEYDKIQENSFLSQIDWEKSVQLTIQQGGQIIQKVQKQMKIKLDFIAFKKKSLQEKKKINVNLPQKHYQERKNRQKILDQFNRKIHQLSQQKREFEMLVRQKIKDYKYIIEQNPKLRNQVKQIQKQATTFQQKIERLKQFNRFLKPKQIEIFLDLKCQFYEISSFVDSTKEWNTNLDRTKLFDLNPEIKVSYNINDKIQKQQNHVYDLNDQIKKKNKMIFDNEKKMPFIRQSQQTYQQELNLRIFEQEKLREQIKLIEDLPQTHKRETQNAERQFFSLDKEIKNEEKQLDHYEKYLRGIYFEQVKKNIIVKNKEKQREKTMKKIKGQCAQLPSQYKNGYFSIFLEFNEQKLTQKAQSQEFKLRLKKVIQNCSRDFITLQTFEQCEIIVLYLSIICYPEKTDIFKYLQLERNSEYEAQKYKIRKQIDTYWYYICQINELKDKKQAGYYEGRQQQQIKQYREKINLLEYQHNTVGNNKRNLSTTYAKLRHMLSQMLTMTDKVQNETDLRLVELMLGFFQCRVIKKCPTLWFLDSEYVIVKSSSILVKTILSKHFISLFCYYFDDNKQFVIMRFKNAYLAMKDLLMKKHISFLYKMEFFDDLAFAKQNIRYIVKSIRDFGQPKTDQSGLKLQLFSNYESKDQVEANYKIFSYKSLQSKIQIYKEQILRFYYENGFKTAETFHFIHYQLKVLDQTYKILMECNNFSNLMIDDLNKKVQNLMGQFDKWKVFIKKEKEITGKSCEDEEKQEEK